MIKKFLKALINIILLLCFFGFFVAAGSLVTFRLLVTGKEIEVPNLIGRRITDALEAANKADLNLKLIEKQFNPEIPEDYVINQKPLPGIKVKSERPIRVIISAGSRTVNVPDLTKKSLRQARVVLHNTGLEIGKVSKVFSNQEVKGLILNQDPLPDEEVRRYSQVSLLVSKGPRFPNLVMPDLVGMKMELVSQVLERTGLNLEDIVTQKSDAEEGMVLMQRPLPGSPVSFGDQIRLVVSGEEGVVGLSLREGLIYKVLNYKVPRGLFRKKIKIILDDEGGSREIYNRIMRPNADLILTFGVQGKARVKIFIDGRLKEERILEEKLDNGGLVMDRGFQSEKMEQKEVGTIKLQINEEIQEESLND